MRKIRNIRYEDGLLIGEVDVIYLLDYKLVIKVLEQLEQSKKNRIETTLATLPCTIE